ncbi:MAG TPA: M56 family metallopeptidase [Pirellulaceae bacterium]|nr:M56 family metallopeptidase [Pirellulaceae bacterium]
MSWLLIVGLKNAILVVPLAGLALGVGRFSKRPALAHALWLIVLVKLLTPPIVDVPVGWRIDIELWLAANAETPQAIAEGDKIAPVYNCPDPAAQADVPGDVMPVAAPAANMQDMVACDPPAQILPASEPRRAIAPAAVPSARSAIASPALWISLGAAVWLLGSAFVVTVIAIRAWRFQRFVRLAARIDDRVAQRVARLARSVGLRCAPRVVVVEGVVSPMLWGLGSRTRLVFPAQLAERLSEAEIDSLLLHELAHFARGDHWVRLLELATHVFYWWHPVVWWSRREIEASEEQCCDAWVIQHQHGSRRSYAEALLTTIDFLCEEQPALPPVACGLGDVPLLRSRLTQIMQGQLAAGLSRGVQALLLGIGIIVSPLQPALWATSSSPRAPQKPVEAAPPVSDGPPAESGPAEPSSAPLPPEPRRAEGSPALAEPIAAAPSILAPLRWTAVSPDGRFRLESRRDMSVRLVRQGAVWPMDFSTYQIRCAAFAPDSKSFITGHADGTVRWWDCETGGHLNTYGDKSAPVTSVAFGPDNRIAMGSANGTLAVWNLATSEETQLTGLPPVACVRWSPESGRLAVGLGSYQSSEGTVLLWDPRTSAEPAEHWLPQPVGALNWLNESSLLVANWSGQCQMLDAASGELSPSVKLDKTLVSAAAWSPDCPLVSAWHRQQLARGAE